MAMLCLGPEGSFSHMAALQASESAVVAHLPNAHEVVAVERISEVFAGVSSGEHCALIAWENNVEGYVVPNLDSLIAAERVLGVSRLSLDVAFHAYALVGDEPGPHAVVACAHPHALAQCQGFIAELAGSVACASNAAACRDLQPGQVALASHACAQRYGLQLWREQVQDYATARTDFLLLAPREMALNALHSLAGVPMQTVVVFIPLQTGPGVLANLLVLLRDAGLNMTSFITRPVKGQAGAYSFIATIDAAGGDPALTTVLRECAERNVWVKVLASYEAQPTHSVPASLWQLPPGGTYPGVDQSQPSRALNTAALRVGIVGLGLIGGSLALRLHDRGVEIFAVELDEASCKAASARGIACCESIADLCAQNLDMLVLCNPLKHMPAVLAELAESLDETVTLCDVGSVKMAVLEQVRQAGLVNQYVGLHPMAGTERSGFAAAHAALFDSAVWAMCVPELDSVADAVQSTQSAQTAQSHQPTQARRVELVRSLIVQVLGNRCIQTSPQVHDQAVALISHMPHVVATALLNCMADSGQPTHSAQGSQSSDSAQHLQQVLSLARELAAGSWRDMTRVARSNTDRNLAMVAANPVPVAQWLERVAADLNAVAEDLHGFDAGEHTCPNAAERLWDFFHAADALRQETASS